MTVRGIVATVVVVAVAVAACEPSDGASNQGQRVQRVEVYELGQDPREAAAFSGNEHIFEARVRSVEAARRVAVNIDGSGLYTGDPSKSHVEYVYTPVRVMVTLVHRGDLRVGQEVTVRHLGGRVDDVSFEMSGVPSLETYEPGVHLLLFTQARVDVGDGVSAMTPNFVYVITDGQARGAVDPEMVLDLVSFRALITTDARTRTSSP